MASMMIFFTFFTGAYGAGTILDEEADGTLQRKISSPIRLSAILGGKSLGIVFILLLQMLVLIALSSLVFGINWGSPFKILIAVFTTTAASTGLGMFLISLCKDRNQTGIVSSFPGNNQKFYSSRLEQPCMGAGSKKRVLPGITARCRSTSYNRPCAVLYRCVLFPAALHQIKMDR